MALDLLDLTDKDVRFNVLLLIKQLMTCTPYCDRELESNSSSNVGESPELYPCT